MPGSVDQRVGVADVLDSSADDGEIRCKLGYHADGTAFDSAAPMWGLGGFVSRTNAPDSEGAAQAFFVQDANRRYVLATRDNRYAAKVGSMDLGDSAIVTDGEARVFVKQQRDAVVLYTENAPADKSMMLDMSGIDGTTRLINGRCSLELYDDGQKAYISLQIAGKAAFTLNSDGIASVNGAYFDCSTSGGKLGSLGMGLPGLPPPVASLLYGPTGMAGVASTSWTVVG